MMKWLPDHELFLGVSLVPDLALAIGTLVFKLAGLCFFLLDRPKHGLMAACTTVYLACALWSGGGVLYFSG